MTPRFVIGVDPGLDGAIAVLDMEHDIVAWVRDMPTLPKPNGGRMIDVYSLGRLLQVEDTVAAVVEHARAMPAKGRKQGATSMLSFGTAFGCVLGALGAVGLPFVTVEPVVWKRRAGLLKKPKDAARALVMSQYRGAKDYVLRKRDIGRADAILIARYGYAV